MQGNIVAEARNVTKSYGGLLALDRVSFRLEEGKKSTGFSDATGPERPR